jgi:hypothetical protein
MVDEPCAEEYVEVARGVLKAVETALEVTHLGRAIAESEELADVHVFLNRQGLDPPFFCWVRIHEYLNF